MKPIAPTAIQHLVQTAQVAAAAPRGNKGKLIDQAVAELGQSRSTVYRRMRQVAVQPARRQRSDAGTTCLPVAEAEIISALLMESHRKNNKQLVTIEHALQTLRYHGTVRAERTDPVTGEVTPLSASAVAKGLKLLCLHPTQLLLPAPCVELRSLHPNHVWQIDASLCVLYYLRPTCARDAGLQVLDADKFYKNKPAALARVEAERVWRYVVTDHYSGSLFVHYVLGAESGINLAESFIAATQQRAGDVMFGVPLVLMMDMGSANTSGLFKNLARRLQVVLNAHMPGNARATGQVEKGQDIVETKFESSLKLAPVASLDELNAFALAWARHFNAVAIHTRHSRTRSDVWLTISTEQLRVGPPAEACRELMTHEPQERQVSPTLTVSFKGREFDVKDIPGILVGEKLKVTYNPYALDCACVLDVAADGSELLHSVPLVERNEAGFRTDANVILEDYTRHADTLADTNRKLVKRLVMEVATDAAELQARKAKLLPFGGRIDPLREAKETVLPTPLIQRGTALVPAVASSAAVQPVRLLTIFEAATALAAQGVLMSRENSARVRGWFPDGVPEDEVKALSERLSVRAGLRVISGGVQ
jgi:hypothetical protein